MGEEESRMQRGEKQRQDGKGVTEVREMKHDVGYRKATENKDFIILN